MEKIVIIDIETTGLNAQTDLIVELGILILDADLHELGVSSWVLASGQHHWDYASPVVIDMHTKNGLIEESVASKLSTGRVEQMAIEWLEHFNIGKVPMTGSSVHFDRAFLAEDMPDLHKRFHYRNFDISTIRQLCQWRFKGVVASVPRGTVEHRAVPDCRHSAAELRHYVKGLE